MYGSRVLHPREVCGCQALVLVGLNFSSFLLEEGLALRPNL